MNYIKDNVKEKYHLKNLDEFLTEHNKCNYTPSEIGPVPKIIALGDLHGDIFALLGALYKSEVIDTDGNWIGGNTVVVQVGDVLDRGGRGNSIDSTNGLEEIQIFHYLYRLNKSARKVGGRVISLIGNHELMNMLGDFRYVSNNHIQALGGHMNRKHLFRPGGTLAKKIACNSLATIKIGDWVFVHGGILPEHIKNIDKYVRRKSYFPISPIQKINDLVRNILLGKISLQDIDVYEEDLLFGGDGIFWTRKYSHGEITENCKTLSDALQLLGVRNGKGGMVVGHTPQKTINSQCNNQVWRIDTGMSEAFGGKANKTDRIEILQIINNGEEISILKD